MKLIRIEKKDNNELEMVIEISPEELDCAIQTAFIKNRRHISVPGFRKGKAPRKMIEKSYGMIFHNDALEAITPDVIKFASSDTEHDVVGYAKITDISIEDDGKKAIYTLLAALRPSVKLDKYKGLKAPKPSCEYAESEVDAEVQSMQERNARIETVDRAAKIGDVTIIDFVGYVDDETFDGGTGENYELELGSGRFIPGFEDQLVGMKTGETRDVNLVFPDEYTEHLAGKPVVFKVTLNELKEKSLPEADDEFAKDVSEFDTIADYKNSIRDRLTKNRQEEIDKTFEGIIMDQIVDSLEVDIPQGMIDEQFDKSIETLNMQLSQYGMQLPQYMQMMGVTPDEFREKMKESSTRQVKAALALEHIATVEKIDISEDEINKEFKSLAEQLGEDIDKIKEKIKSRDIERDLRLKAAMKLILDSAVPEKFDKSKYKDEDLKKSIEKKTPSKKNKKKSTE